MTYKYGSHISSQLPQIFYDDFLALAIDSGGSLVQKKKSWMFDQSSSKNKSLFLPTWKIVSSILYNAV